MANMNVSSILGGTYRVEFVLSSGSGGAVYKAWHKRLQKYVVIKEFVHSSVLDGESRRNEVEALKNVKSAHLPQVLDFITESERSLTVMEFIEGESFAKLLKRGRRFSQSQIIRWYGQLASALEELHRHNICHRDIKPANIMLTPNGNVCLIDFNAAIIRGNDTRFVSRSRGYASPEQYKLYNRLRNLRYTKPCRRNAIGIEPFADDIETMPPSEDLTRFTENRFQGEHPAALPFNIDWKRSDIYSLGATMYHILMCKRPKYSIDEEIILSDAGMWQKSKHGRCGKALSCFSVIERSVRSNPGERFSSAIALSSAILRISHQNKQKRISESIKAFFIISIIIIAALLSGQLRKLR